MKLEDKDILKSLYEIKMTSRERYFEAKGIDISKVKKMEEDISAKYKGLADKLKIRLKEAGEIEAKQQELSLERIKRIDQKNLDSLLEGKLTILHDPPVRGPCWCYAIRHANFVGNDTVTIPPEAFYEVGKATVEWEVDKFMAHPIVDLYSIANYTNSGTAIAQFKFAFTPVDDGYYCIKPVVQMNGHWLLWTWGSCPNEDIGSGSVKVINRIVVDQLSSNVETFENTVLDETTQSPGQDVASGFFWDKSPKNIVYLEGGHEAVIKVECEITATMHNWGRAWIDMQSSKDFYFKVPWVSWGREQCISLHVPGRIA